MYFDVPRINDDYHLVTTKEYCGVRLTASDAPSEVDAGQA
jgi:hypothetical protein